MEKIHDLVFDQICPNSKGNKSYSICFQKYCNNAVDLIGEQASNNEPLIIPGLSLEKTYGFFNSMDSTEFALIWQNSEDVFRTGMIDNDEPYDTVQYISVNRSSKYMTFIYEMEKSQNELVSAFVKKNRAPQMYVKMITNEYPVGYRPEFRLLVRMLGYPEYFDASDPKIRLMISVSILSTQYHQNQKRLKTEQNGA